jgi:MFS family permease
VLVLLFSLSFSFSSAFMSSFIHSPGITIYAPLLSDAVLSDATTGYFAGVAACVAAVVAFSSGIWSQRSTSKGPLMFIGAAGMLTAALPCVIMLGGSHTVRPKNTAEGCAVALWELALLYVGQGVGRGVFESTYRAVIADLFESDAAAGFANVQMANGVSAAAAYFLFPALTGYTAAMISTIAAPAGFVGYCAACMLQRCAGVPEFTSPSSATHMPPPSSATHMPPPSSATHIPPPPL